jgi:hypothetical protein
MLLINKITLHQLTIYRKEVIKCLKNNINNGYINEIIVFLDIVDENLPKHNKVRYITKPKYNDLEIIEYCKKISNIENIIFSKSLHSFGSELRFFNVGDYIESQNFIFFKRNYDIKSKLIYVENKKTVTKKKPLKVNKPVILESKENSISNKLDVVIVSVNYNDYLKISLENNTKIFDNITVVTSEDDIECQEICNNYGVNYIISKRIYENGDSFNKGKAINDGIRSLKNPDWILILDADIVVNGKFDINDLNTDILYYSNRYICNKYEDYIEFKEGRINIENIGRLENKVGLGFFQLYNYRFNRFLYPENFKDAGWSDIKFRDKFNIKEKVENINCIHLGDVMLNWGGRISNTFIEYKSYKIGIGITTHNRSILLEEVIKNIVKNTSHINKIIVVIDDNSNYENKSKNKIISKKYGINYSYNEVNLGISKSKNKCIESLEDCDYIFLFDDDCYPIVDNWWLPFIEASKEFNFGHFSLTFDKNYQGRPNGNNLIKEIKRNNIIIEEYSNPCGILLFMTNECINKIGGFDNNYDIYGKEHVGYSIRCKNIGMTEYNFLSVKDTLKYFYSYDYESKISSSIKYERKKQSRAINDLVFEVEKKSFNYKFYKKENILITHLEKEVDINDWINYNGLKKYNELIIILHKNLSVDFVKKETTSSIKFYRVDTMEEFIRDNLIYIENYKYIKTYIKDNIILSTILTGVNDIQRDVNWLGDNFDYIKDWYNSIKDFNIKAIIFHNTFSDETVLKYETDNIKFIKVSYDVNYLNPNVYRYFIYKKYIEENKLNIENLFITDITDVVVLSNPFNSNFFKENKNYIFCGDEETILGSEWMINHNEHLRNKIDDFINYEKKYSKYKLLNCGIIGGEVNIISDILSKICKIHSEVTISNKTKYTCDMGVFNYIIKKYYSDKVKHGSPINTKFKYFELDNKECWFRHK